MHILKPDLMRSSMLVVLYSLIVLWANDKIAKPSLNALLTPNSLPDDLLKKRKSCFHSISQRRGTAFVF